MLIFIREEALRNDFNFFNDGGLDCTAVCNTNNSENPGAFYARKYASLKSNLLFSRCDNFGSAPSCEPSDAEKRHIHIHIRV